MFLMFGDEADAEQGRGQKFFVYGAIFVESNSAKQLHDAIELLRKRSDYHPTDSLKFAHSSKPKAMTRDQFRDVKKKTIELAKTHNVTFCAYVSSHALARNQTHDDRVLWGANTLLGKFNEFLGTDRDEYGIALFDRPPVKHEYQYLKEKFQTGLALSGGSKRQLERIIGFASTTDGASHLASVADVLIGSFRYCVNEEDRDAAGRAMFPDLVDLMWKRRNFARELGFVLRPKDLRLEPHRSDYQALLDRLQRYLDGHKPPTG